MPAERTGVADYAAALVDDSSNLYAVTVITDSPCRISNSHSLAWLMRNGWRFDRTCHHIGNSPFHRSIRECLGLWLGAVVLHELFHGDLVYSL